MRTDRQAYMMKLIVVFIDFAKAPKKVKSHYVPVHAMKAYIGRNRYYSTNLIFFALVGAEGSTSSPDGFTFV
jgi:hypothetical protein